MILDSTRREGGILAVWRGSCEMGDGQETGSTSDLFTEDVFSKWVEHLAGFQLCTLLERSRDFQCLRAFHVNVQW